MNLKINEEVKQELQRIGVHLNEGIPILLGIYFGYSPEYIPHSLRTKVLSSKIISMDYKSETLDWKIPLFEGKEEEFGWVEEYMDMFKKINKDRRGLKSTAIKRMKKFFATYPDIRKEEVFQATKEYMKTVSDPTYLITSHKFISNIEGEPLKDWVDTIRTYKRDDKNPDFKPFKRIV